MRSLFVSAAALVIAAAPAAAQKAGTVEIGAFGRVTWFDDAYQLQNKIGFGGRLGFFPLRNLEIEGQVSYIPTNSTDTLGPSFDENVGVLSGRGFLEYNINFKPMALILGAGVAYSGYGGFYDTIPGHTDNIGPAFLVGLRFGVGGVLQARIDGTYDYVTSPAEFTGGRQRGQLGPSGWSLPRVPEGEAEGLRQGRRDRQARSVPEHPARHQGGREGLSDSAG